MAKSVYSLVLGQEVVKAVDAVASVRGTNRSALVNHILAEYVNLTTVESQAEIALQALLQAAAGNGLRVSAQRPGAVTLQTSLSYKYNPALQYTVEMRGIGGEWGRLKLALRSQNKTVLDGFRFFVELWDTLEQRHLAHPPHAGERKSEPKRYQRILRRPNLGDEAAGHAVAEYVALLDSCLKTYFRSVGSGENAVWQTEEQYLRVLRAVNELDSL